MKLWNFARQDVTITLKNGHTISGYVQDYISALDNDEEVDSISVDIDGTLYEYFENEILNISLV